MKMNFCRYQLRKVICSNRTQINLSQKPLTFISCQNLSTGVLGTRYIEDSYIKKFMKAVGWMDQSRTKLKLSGYFLYESIPKKVAYTEWFDKFELPDTFASWFTITELHVWLLMVRCMAEDEMLTSTEKKQGDGCFIRNCIVEALWADVANRSKLLEGTNSSLVKKQTSELSDQFQAAIIGYDEGLVCDRIMAGAVWRRFYCMSQDANITHIENIVKFIRKQVMELDKLPGQQLRTVSYNSPINWLQISR